ncbi:EARP-interacting protein homolog [Hetaerina americana]|uniref:EARP-interacting protein homolog n=1 Tax=Hetaerina americana TaxID=62018 RepID=UPI003A7F3F41
MDTDSPLIYGLEFQARALASQLAETECLRFFVGTQSLEFDNQIHVVEVDEKSNSICKKLYQHGAGEVWHLSSSPTDNNVISTCFNKISEGRSSCTMHAAIWRIPETTEEGSGNEGYDPCSAALPTLDQLSLLETNEYGKDVLCTVFHPTEGNRVVSVVDNHFILWDLGEGCSSAKAITHGVLEAKGQPKFSAGKWNPHQSFTQFVTANDTHVRSWDLRTPSRQVWTIEGAHSQLIRDLDFNPNRQYYMASCGDDGWTKFWDVRSPTEPVVARSDHSHWVWSVRYNPLHDQLVLTSSSDSRVILSCVASISSEPYGHCIDDDLHEDNEEEKEKPSKMEDGVLAAYDEHEDSVYAVEWSTANPWTFASLSYDGRLVINRVPRAEMYRIIL